MKIILVIAIIAVSCFVSFWLRYWKAIDYATDMLDREFEKKFKDAGIVVKKDDRIIECNGMISDNCKKCIFGRQPVWNVIECFAPDFDGIPVFGVTKDRSVNKEM